MSDGFANEVAKRIMTGTHRVVLDHSGALVLCGVAAGGCQADGTSCAAEKQWAAVAIEELAGRLRTEVGGCSKKK